ncbi:MAG: type II toxin-antitoxin system YoeB family toxin [Bacteroidia bacterium]|nr:type II toxin-antitoxin system YoeB family toxin [Bacteroidia bacterium]
MILEFLPKALESYKSIKANDPDVADKFKSLLNDILAHPETGNGSPIQLQGKYRGIWIRQVSYDNAIYYTFNEEKVLILSLSVPVISGAIAPGENSGRQNLAIESFSENEYASVMALMAANRGKDSQPKVGIFWYNRARNELFGVISHRVSDYSKANASDGRITCSEMHEDIWKREFRKQKYHGDDKGPYVGAYQDKPRGRVFYNIKSDTFEVAVGKWIEEYPDAYQLILEEFNLPPNRTSLKYAIHWDIGMSWR